ncbi:HAD family hydrolase [Variovorax sp. RCC_210]|uniref:HAD family hydrolase n=1 Tax=Variovorax sp. RCC_210 TaxID=3239217 RepID=UPI003524D0CA
MNPRAVLFDLDNTLTHRARSIASYARQFAADCAGALDVETSGELVASIIAREDCGGYLPPGSRFASIQEAIGFALANGSGLRWKSAPSAEQLRAHWAGHFPQHAVEMPGASKLLRQLSEQGFHVGIVSNGAERSRRATVDALGFGDAVGSLLSSERSGFRKPDPRIFLQAAAEAGVDARDCWYVGDHPVNDIVGAVSAGMQAVWLEGFHDWPSDQPEPRLRVACLSEVWELLAY